MAVTGIEPAQLLPARHLKPLPFPVGYTASGCDWIRTSDALLEGRVLSPMLSATQPHSHGDDFSEIGAEPISRTSYLNAWGRIRTCDGDYNRVLSPAPSNELGHPCKERGSRLRYVATRRTWCSGLTGDDFPREPQAPGTGFEPAPHVSAVQGSSLVPSAARPPGQRWGPDSNRCRVFQRSRFPGACLQPGSATPAKRRRQDSNLRSFLCRSDSGSQIRHLQPGSATAARSGSHGPRSHTTSSGGSYAARLHQRPRACRSSLPPAPATAIHNNEDHRLDAEDRRRRSPRSSRSRVTALTRIHFSLLSLSLSRWRPCS